MKSTKYGTVFLWIDQFGTNVPRISVGKTVGLGWYSGSCLPCPQCMKGDHNLCGSREQTIVGRHRTFSAQSCQRCP